MSENTSTTAIGELYRAMRAVIDESTLSDHREAFADLREMMSTEPRLHGVEPASQSVTDEWLVATLAADNPRWPALSRVARTALPLLRWQVSYTNLPPSPGLASFQDDYSWAPLVLHGAESPVQIAHGLVGFTVQAPGITYPGHHHKPVEIYGIISGQIEWKVGEGPWELKQPGDVIVHRSHELHAMRTLDEPCLTWAAWDSRNADAVYMPSLDPPGERMDPISY